MAIKQLAKIRTGNPELDRVQDHVVGVLNPILRALPQAGTHPTTPAGQPQTGVLYMGQGAPANANGNPGDFYLRTDTPGTANQRLYVKSAGAWTGIL